MEANVPQVQKTKPAVDSRWVYMVNQDRYINDGETYILVYQNHRDHTWSYSIYRQGRHTIEGRVKGYKRPETAMNLALKAYNRSKVSHV